MHTYPYILIPLLLAATLPGCSDSPQADPIVAQVGDATLTRTNLLSSMPESLTGADSAVFVDQAIRHWVYRQVLLQKASQYLSQQTDDIDAAVEEYRSSLIIETYQNKLVEQKFRPQITNDDIQDYYNKMRQSFVLPDPIIKGCYAIIPSNAPHLKDFLSSLSQLKEENMLQIEQYMFSNASKYQNSLDSWLSLSQIRNFLPADMLPADIRQLSRLPYAKCEKDGNTYILKVTHCLPAGEVAPLEFVTKNITDILISKKKLEFLNNANRDIYDQATKEGRIKYYDNK